MPHLLSESGAMRLALDLVTRESDTGRVVATAAIEWLDRRDGEWWPFVRLPVVHLDAGTSDALVQGLRDLLQGGAPGFAWTTGDRGALGLQFSANPAGSAVVEAGVDLGSFLAESAGVAGPRGEELALFRFVAPRTDLVRFAGDVEAQAQSVAGR